MSVMEESLSIPKGELTPHQMKVFLDRYALKGEGLAKGDMALVYNKTVPQYGQVVKILECSNSACRVKLEDGSESVLPASHLIKLLETHPMQMWQRVAKGIAAVEANDVDREKWEKIFLEALADFKFVPGGRILAGAGTGQAVTFFNCYVIPRPQDSRKGIIKRVEEMVEIMSRGGGVGINISSLRPRGAYVKGVNGTSSGPVSWACVFSTATGSVEQGGTRQGALMVMLDDWHPDIIEFITFKKKNPGQLTKANLSVAVSDKFMEALANDEDWNLVYPDIDDPDYREKWDGDLNDWIAMGKKVITYRTLKARELWDLIAEYAHGSGEPGVVFMERYNKLSNTYYFEKIVSVNPCGEQGLPPWGVCNLGAINLAKFVTAEGKVDYEELDKNVRVAVRFLDNVIDATEYFFKENEDRQKNSRRIGLGTMGLADALIKMKVRYGSPESIQLIDEIYRRIKETAYDASVEIAKEKGSFPAFVAEKYVEGAFIQQLPSQLRNKIKKYGIRNATLLTQAPTGTTSIMAQASSGIEPVFAFKYKRKDRLGEHFVYHHLAQEWIDQNGSEELPDFFVTANELTPEEHVKIQGVIQAHVDSSISKTVNAPNHHTVDDTREVFTKAYELGAKGITYFRDGSLDGVLERIEPPKEEEKKGAEPVHFTYGPKVEEVPEEVEGKTYRVKSHLGTARVIINEVDGQPFEVIVILGKGGSDLTAMAEALGRTISLNLRTRSDVPKLERLGYALEQLQGINGSGSYGFGPNRVTSLPDAVAKAIARYLMDKAAEGEETYKVKESAADICPTCGAAALVREEGCSKCYICGFSKC